MRNRWKALDLNTCLAKIKYAKIGIELIHKEISNAQDAGYDIDSFDQEQESLAEAIIQEMEDAINYLRNVESQGLTQVARKN